MAQLHEMSRFGSSRGRCAGACRRGRGAGSGRVSRRCEVVGGLDLSNGSSLVCFSLFGGKEGEPNDKEDDTSIFVPHFLDIYSALYFFYKSLWKRNKELEQLATNFLNLRLCGEGISFEKIQYLINIFCKLKCESTRLKDYFSELFNLGT